MSTGTGNTYNRYLLKLAGLAVILQILGWTVSTFPFFLFFAYAPLFAACQYLNHNDNKFSKEAIFSLAVVFLIPGLFKFIVFKPTFIGYLAGLSPVVAFIFWFYSGIRLGRLRFLYLVFFWLGSEYIFISISPPTFSHMPGAAFRLWGESFVWMKFTGFQGLSVWLLLTNIFFSRSFFEKDGRLLGKINRPVFLAATGIGVLPMAISMVTYNRNPPANLTPFFDNPSVYWNQFNLNPFYSFYLDYGEYLGKTSFWISIFILLSLFVKDYLSKDGH